MSKEFLCKCNECGLVMFDENPSDNAIKVEIDTLPEPPSNLEQIYDEFAGEYFWGCPNCKDDSYLSDKID